MKELSRTRRLTIVTTIFVIIIIIGFLTFRKPPHEYQITPVALLTEITNPQNEFEKIDLSNASTENHDGKILVDLRNPYQYLQGSFPDAVNIPVSDILSDESLSFFGQAEKDSKQVIVFSDDMLEANGVWMMLRQLGYGKIKVYPVNYPDTSQSNDLQGKNAEFAANSHDTPVTDFSQLTAETSGESVKAKEDRANAPIIVPVRRVKKTVKEGGC